ncbi:MAG: hypothetical protein ABI072_06115, partial [Edaphobacter sp.]
MLYLLDRLECGVRAFKAVQASRAAVRGGWNEDHCDKKGVLVPRFFSIALLIGLIGGDCLMAQAPAAAAPAVAAPAVRPVRPTPPTRDPHTPGYVAAKELPDGENAPANVGGNFILGPTHTPAP